MDYLTQRFIADLKRLREELVALRKSIEAIRDEQETHHQSQQAHQSLPPPVLRVNAKIHEPKEIQRQKRSSDNRNFCVQLALTIGTWLAFIAAAIYAGIASGQLNQMKVATTAATSTADTANKTFGEIQKQTTLMHQQLVGTLGASVVPLPVFAAAFNPDSPTGFLRTKVGVGWRNVGQVPASNVEAHFDIIKQLVPDRRVRGNPITEQRHISLLLPSHEHGMPNMNIPEVYEEYEITFAANETEMLHQTQETITMKGTFAYDDGFGDRLERPFCYTWFYWQAKTKTGTSNDGGQFRACDDYWSEIANIVRRKKEIESQQ